MNSTKHPSVGCDIGKTDDTGDNLRGIVYSLNMYPNMLPPIKVEKKYKNKQPGTVI